MLYRKKSLRLRLFRQCVKKDSGKIGKEDIRISDTFETIVTNNNADPNHFWSFSKNICKIYLISSFSLAALSLINTSSTAYILQCLCFKPKLLCGDKVLSKSQITRGCITRAHSHKKHLSRLRRTSLKKRLYFKQIFII